MSFFDKLKNGLNKTKNNIDEKINEVFSNFRKVDEDLLEELEEALIMSDIGMDTSLEIIDNLRKKIKLENLKEAEDVKKALRELMKEILDKQDVAVYIIKTLYKLYPSKLEEFYNITSIIDFEEVFNIIAKKKGLLQKGGIPNYDRVIDLIINDIKSGKIKDITFDRISHE